jgi:predicted DsbA family dithiol-disulfide isomerase
VGFCTDGLTGSTFDSHRLLEWAAEQGLDAQNALATQLFKAYHTDVSGGRRLGSS